MSDVAMRVMFFDPTGTEIQVLSERRCGKVDRVAVEETGPNLYPMVENAGRNLAPTAMDIASTEPDGPVLVLAGTGGGGIAAARHLANHGLKVLVVITDESRHRVGRESALSLDMPSGIDATTGHAPGIHVAADTTMTLALPNHGFGNSAAGSVILADLGIPIETFRRAGVRLQPSPSGTAYRVPLSRAPRTDD